MIVDSHVHIFPPDFIRDRKSLLTMDQTFSELYSDTRSKLVTAEDLICLMDENGIDVSVVMGIGWTNSILAEKSNQYIAESCERFPDRLIGFGSIDLSSAYVFDQVRYLTEIGLKGIGELHLDHQLFKQGGYELITPIIQEIRSHDLVLAIHCSEPVGHLYPGKGTNTPEKLETLLNLSQGVNVILSHWGGGMPFYGLMPEIRKLLESVFFDTAASPFLYDRTIFQIVSDIVGANHILAASDYPLLQFSRIISEIEQSSMSNQDKKLILGDNAKTLFNLA
ncbi:MAG: amidohydrolase family protein [SAR202 cluster bacterium]|nr:amidohydrolase family protein [SAR202 cluster bacterium]